MSEQPSPNQPESSGGEPSPVDPQSHPRLGPRPLDRPSVEAGQAAVFGRPQGVPGAFGPRLVPAAGSNGQHADPTAGLLSSPPPPEALASAFGRPTNGSSVLLQRPPGATDGDRSAEDDHWSDAEADPWRDPGAAPVLGPPAVADDTPTEKVAEPARPTAALLSVPELLFGRRVKPTALIMLLVSALLVGVVGGVIGWALSSGAHSLTDAGDSLAQVDQNVQRAPGSVAGIVSRVAPAVVSLEVTAGTGGDIGSGVVIDAKGYILTNNHVIADAATTPGSTITAVFSSGARVSASIVGRDPVTDLAVLKVNATNLTVIRLGTANTLKPGDSVIAIGSPLGLAGTVTSGIVSALHRPQVLPSEDGGPNVIYDAIQTDAAINPGNSGGALVDSAGALVGINSAIQTFGSSDGGQSGNIGLGFAIPVDQAKKIAQQLIQTGRVKHADMGVNTRSVSATTSQGAQVENVKTGGAAAAAGIQEGDVITNFGGRSIGSSDELQVAIIDDDPGQTVSVQFDRQGQQHTVSVTLQSD
ncbi:MAG TPA: trypsin-like peptidase domain-containing protein [Pseudonocardiaceae bacterium]|jgi:S1-C subfamily serine protease|nr:trypsin-like peptidase domain-containing protein [Pseudonocardiaceae bacterium]